MQRFIWKETQQAFQKQTKKGTNYWAYGGDFGPKDVWTDGNFNCNGLVDPNRNPHPGLYEVKKVYQYIGFKTVDITKGTFKIINKNDFLNLDNFNFDWVFCLHHYFRLKAKHKVKKQIWPAKVQ